MIPESSSLTLIVVLFIVVLWFLFEEIWDLSLFTSRSRHQSVINLSTLRALSLFEHHEGITAVDVRPQQEYEARHLPGAVNAPFDEENLDGSTLKDFPRDNPLLVYCGGGFRSRRALEKIAEEGFTRVFHLNRGILMWRLFGGPTETGVPQSPAS